MFTRVPFTWYVALGSAMTFAVGYGLSFILPDGTVLTVRNLLATEDTQN
jgi:hypothetical protein